MTKQNAVRHINKAKLLELLFRYGPQSRADSARKMGVMRSTAGDLISELLSNDIVTAISSDKTTSNRDVGRPGRLLDINPKHSYFIGADINRECVLIVIIDLKANVIIEHEADIHEERCSPDHVVDLLAQTLESLFDQFNIAIGHVRGLCITAASPVNRDGVIMRAANLGWKNVPIVELMSKRFPELKQVVAENDANAFAIAETYVAGSKSASIELYFWISAGIGAGIIHDSNLVRGTNGIAGEFGTFFSGLNTFDEQRLFDGTLNGLIGQEALLLFNRKQGGQAENLDAFLSELSEGNLSSINTVKSWINSISISLANLVCIFDPGRIVLGGPVSQIAKHYEKHLIEAVADKLPNVNSLPIIELATHNRNVVAIGAAYSLHKSFMEINEGVVYGHMLSDDY